MQFSVDVCGSCRSDGTYASLNSHSGLSSGLSVCERPSLQVPELEVMDLPPPVSISPNVFVLTDTVDINRFPERSYPQYCFGVTELSLVSYQAGQT